MSMNRMASRSPQRALARRAVALCLCLASALLLFGPIVSSAAEIEGVAFAEELDASGTPLPLHGVGLLRYRVLFKGYVGGLYIPAGVDAQDALSDVPKALELSYFWEIEGKLFGDAASSLLAETESPERLAALRPQLDDMHALYRDVQPGDRYRLTYVPGRGTTLHYNDEILGTVPGADFARAYFGIWLGKKPLSTSFRDQLFEGR